MSLTPAMIDKLMNLSHLSLDSEQQASFLTKFESVVSLISQIQEAPLPTPSTSSHLQTTMKPQTQPLDHGASTELLMANIHHPKKGNMVLLEGKKTS